MVFFGGAALSNMFCGALAFLFGLLGWSHLYRIAFGGEQTLPLTIWIAVYLVAFGGLYFLYIRWYGRRSDFHQSFMFIPMQLWALAAWAGLIALAVYMFLPDGAGTDQQIYTTGLNFWGAFVQSDLYQGAKSAIDSVMGRDA